MALVTRSRYISVWSCCLIGTEGQPLHNLLVFGKILSQYYRLVPPIGTRRRNEHRKSRKTDGNSYLDRQRQTVTEMGTGQVIGLTNGNATEVIILRVGFSSQIFEYN